jgi:hypothetical protein
VDRESQSEIHVAKRKLKIVESGSEATQSLASRGDWAPLIDAALEIGKARNRLLTQLREAVLANDREAVFNIAQQLVGGAQ